ncbi:DUF433 domain-containing protein [Alienimonas chondri]|uniref:DUF433 domain-containing protein n=1 Tax=Alienimonas chondri TaxID=2681879 RepID=A0ABX1VFP7_9PLAN|nr:hypothetical protein [Alienimonas chondri]NNJ26087.1 hypothetical protein [Alienimonas chondri]
MSAAPPAVPASAADREAAADGSSARERLPIGRMTVDADGTVYANASRFKARLIVEAYKAGVSPEEYASPEMYGHAVTEADVHAVIAWYLQNREAVDEELRDRARTEEEAYARYLADPKTIERRDRLRRHQDAMLRAGRLPRADG